MAWSLSSVLTTLASRQVSSPVVNRIRLLLALAWIGGAHWLILGEFFPTHAEPIRYGWLALSGVIGLAIGDSLLYQAFVLIGPRLSMLLLALAPVESAVLGWFLLDERLNRQDVLGIALTIGGIMLVVSDRHPARLDESAGAPQRHGAGVLFGLGASLGQAGGLLASKLGMAGGFPPLSANAIRLATATLAIWLVTLALGQVGPSIDRLREHPRALIPILGTSVVGPSLGVWLALVAIQNAPLGIASTLTSLSPIFLLPVGHLFFKERVGLPAILGTLVTFGGTVLLFV
jgi:uncharacterized membrane protein